MVNIKKRVGIQTITFVKTREFLENQNDKLEIKRGEWRGGGNARSQLGCDVQKRDLLCWDCS